MPKRCFENRAQVLLLLSLIVPLGSPARASDEPESPGALDPTLPGNLGPASNQILRGGRPSLYVGENKLVNDRTLCPDGRGLNQNETSIAVSESGRHRIQ